MRVRSGTSGFSYDEWKGSFYPADLPKDQMLAHYARQLPAVEINNTFYRMPRADLLAKWAGQVPEGFRFVLKAPRRITHSAKLAGAGDAVNHLWKVSSGLGKRLGAILFQLPPTLKKDVPRLEAFFAELPEGCRAAFEFRHASWFDDDVFSALRGRAALVIADVDDEELCTPLQATADFGFLRLRRSEYDEAAVEAWAERIAAQPWTEAFAFFKHEQLGPSYALALNACFARPVAKAGDKPRAKGVAAARPRQPQRRGKRAGGKRG